MTPETKLPPAAKCSSFGKDYRYPPEHPWGPAHLQCWQTTPFSNPFFALFEIRLDRLQLSRAAMRLMFLSAFATLIYGLPTAAPGKTHSILLMCDFSQNIKSILESLGWMKNQEGCSCVSLLFSIYCLEWGRKESVLGSVTIEIYMRSLLSTMCFSINLLTPRELLLLW